MLLEWAHRPRKTLTWVQRQRQLLGGVGALRRCLLQLVRAFGMLWDM